MRQVREEAGLSRAALARASDLSERTLKRIEDDETYEPTVVTKNKIRNGLNKTLNLERKYDLHELFPEEETAQ